MARPKKQVSLYSTRFPTVQGTEEMVNTAKAKAKSLGMRYSDYARQQLTGENKRVSENDNAPSSFELALIHVFKTDIGQHINQMAKAANQTKVLPVNLKQSLNRLERFIDHVRFSVRLVEVYNEQAKKGTWHSSKIFTFSFTNQLMKVGTNLLQLSRIAEKNENALLEDLGRCQKKLTPLIDGMISKIK